MNFQTVATISPQVGATGTWSCDMQLIPHPVSFAAYFKNDSTGTSSSEVLNSQLAGIDHIAKLAGFIETFRKWRLAYASVTVYQDGPDLANQGTVVACQKPMDLQMFCPTVGNVNGVYTAPVGHLPVWNILADELPNYTTTQAMPNAYFGQSKEGVYVPLKLSPNHQRWHGRHDLAYQGQTGAIQTNPSSPYWNQFDLQYTGTPTSTGTYPFTTLNNLHFYQSGGSDGRLAGTATSNFCNDNWADICFRNLAVTSSLSMFFRFGFECQVDPVSIYSPQLKLSPEYDAQAIATYFSIARTLKDGYPADFNDLGKIWGVIKEAASTIAPVLSFLPGGSAVVKAGETMGKVVDKTLMPALLQRASAPSRGNTSSASDIEKVQEAKKKANVVDELQKEAARSSRARPRARSMPPRRRRRGPSRKL